MFWQLLITNLVCAVQGLIRLSDIIRLGRSNPVNNNCFLFTFVQCTVMPYACERLTNFANSRLTHACIIQKAYQLNVNAVIMVPA